jgi:putative heme-binding domain-containing protein
VRGAAVRLMAWADRGPENPGKPIADLPSLTADSHPQVRLEAIRALARFPSVAGVEAMTKALDLPMDRWLDYALWLAQRESASVWLPKLESGELTFGGNAKQIVYALRASGSQDVAKPLLKLLQSGKIPSGQQDDAWLTLAELGGREELGTALVMKLDGKNPDFAGRLLNAVVDNIKTRKTPAPAVGLETVLLNVLQNNHHTSRQAASRLVGLWKLKLPMLLANLAKADKSLADVTTDDRKAALEGLVLLGGAESLATLKTLTGETESSETRRLAIAALANLDTPGAAKLAAVYLAKSEALAENGELFAAFLSRKDGSTVLDKALAGVKLPADTAKIGLKAVKAMAQPDAKLLATLSTAGGLTQGGWKLKGEELNTFLGDVAKLGNPARGEAIYRRGEMNCLKCHAIAGAGGQVGPDMSSIGASAPVDYLLESLLNPNAKIKEGYNSFIITTDAGKIINGIKVRESPTELVLRDAENKETLIPIADIAERKNGMSLMPAGLVDPLTRQELLDLTRFLTELGKGSYAATPGKVVRNWQSLQPTKEMYTVLNRQSLTAVTKSPEMTWAPSYSLVSGDFDRVTAPVFKWKPNAPELAVVRFTLDVTAAGPAKLNIPDMNGLMLWLDGESLELGAPLNLKPGTATITVAIEWAKRTTPLRIELDEVPGAATRVKLGVAK